MKSPGFARFKGGENEVVLPCAMEGWLGEGLDPDEG